MTSQKSEERPRARSTRGQDVARMPPTRLRHVLDPHSQRPLSNLEAVAMLEALRSHPQMPESQVYAYLYERLKHIVNDHLDSLANRYALCIDHQNVDLTFRRAHALDQTFDADPCPFNRDEADALRQLDCLPPLLDHEWPDERRKLLADSAPEVITDKPDLMNNRHLLRRKEPRVKREK